MGTMTKWLIRKAKSIRKQAGPIVEKSVEVARKVGHGISAAAVEAEKVSKKIERGRQRAERISRRASATAERLSPNLGHISGMSMGMQSNMGIEPHSKIDLLPQGNPNFTLMETRQKKKRKKGPFEL